MLKKGIMAAALAVLRCGGLRPETAGDARQGGRRRGFFLDSLFRGGGSRASAHGAAPRGGVHLRPRSDERGARSADDPETALQSGADRLGEDQCRRYRFARRGAGAEHDRGRGIDSPARSQAPHGHFQHPREHASALRGAVLRQLHAERGCEQGRGHSGRGRAFLQVDRQGQPADHRRAVCLCADHPFPQVDHAGQAAYARASAGHARTRHHGQGQVRESGPHVFAGPRNDDARRRNGPCAARQSRLFVCRGARKHEARTDFGGRRIAVRIPHHSDARQAGESLPFPPYPAASGLYDRRAYGGARIFWTASPI